MSNRGTAICLGCGERMRDESRYLCRLCWFMLPDETRRRLRRRDAAARERLFQLFSAMRRRVPLAQIQVST